MYKKNFFSIDCIRKSWIEIFEKNNYLFINSSSLIPNNDHSLLWINSGVASLKKYYSGELLPPSSNMVNCQRVMRLEDLNNVSSNSCHQTLFEMLGSFSIGGNFKDRIIPIVLEWFTSSKWLNLDLKNIFVTVWEKDYICQDIWKMTKIKKKNIIFGNKKTNFWDMGNGPCGPNSEIYYKLSSIDNNKKNFSINDLENNDFIEICNIVFPEFYHKEKILVPMIKKCVDVGAGLERICMIVQKKKNNFDIDLWEGFDNYLSKKNNKKKNFFYIILDHLRTIIFALGDGGFFDQKGRGYTLKKLMKRLCVFSYLLNINKETIINLSFKIIEKNSLFYKFLEIKKKKITDDIIIEFEKFIFFIDECNKKIKKYNLLKVEEIFFLYDTKGIPLELIKKELKRRKKTFPSKDFNKFLLMQKKRSEEDRKKKNIKIF